MFNKPRGIAATITFPLVMYGDTSFKSAPTIATGDCKIEKDEGGMNNTGSLPAETGSGTKNYSLALTAAEMNAERIDINFIDQTSPALWEDVQIKILTH